MSTRVPLNCPAYGREISVDSTRVTRLRCTCMPMHVMCVDTKHRRGLRHSCASPSLARRFGFGPKQTNKQASCLCLGTATAGAQKTKAATSAWPCNGPSRVCVCVYYCGHEIERKQSPGNESLLLNQGHALG